MMKNRCSDNNAQKFPVSIKGVIFYDHYDVPLLKNEREEFELPGGKLEKGEQPKDCLVREIEEELSIDVKVVSMVDFWLYEINHETQVVIVTYLCVPMNQHAKIKISNEHKSYMMASIKSINGIVMPDNYKKSIICAYEEIKRAEFTREGFDMLS